MTTDIELRGTVWMTVGGEGLGGHGRVGLLRAIDETGSITHAAKAIGMSYKAAWDAVDTMNNLAGAPLVERSAGGRGGGSTRLTERGRQLVRRYAEVQALHRRFVDQLSAGGADLGRDLDLLQILTMKTTARNQYAGTIGRVTAGAVNDEVELTLPSSHALVATVTHESVEALRLAPGVAAFALVQAASVMLVTELAGARLSARNQLAGRVAHITPGAVNAEVVLSLGDDPASPTMAALVTQSSVATLGLVPGMAATAVFKAGSVILGVAP